MKTQIIYTFLFLIPFASLAQTQYIVRKGDTILKIADKNLGTTDKKDLRRYEYAKKIQKLNPNIKNFNQLEPGQTLIIPAKDMPVFVDIKKPAPAERPAVEVRPAKPVVQEILIPKEAPVESAIHKLTEAHPNFIFLQPRYQIVQLESRDLATDTEADLKSKSSFGIDLQYRKIINEQFHLLFQAGLTQTHFKDIEGAATEINHTSETTKSFGVGLAYEATHSLHLELMMSYADRSFLLPEGSGIYKLESVGIPGAELNLSWDFYAANLNTFGISAIGEYIGNYSKDNIDYKSSFEPFGALYWRSNYGPDRNNYKISFTYKHGHQKTNVSEQKEELMVLGLGFYF